MASRIGPDLHRARTRREIELPGVEAATRIRARFLHAIEQEEWDVLPGGVYTRGFIRAYANFLGLDGDRLAEDYRREVEGVQPPEPVAATSPRRAGRPDRAGSPRRPAAIALVAVALVAAIAIFALPGGGGEAPTTSRHSPGPGRSAAIRQKSRSAIDRSPAGVSMRLAASGEVWVCLLDAGGRPLVDGQILEAGAATGPFRSDSFTVSFGNGEVTMTIDGRKADIPRTSSPIGYSIDSSGTLTELSEVERPTCA